LVPPAKGCKLEERTKRKEKKKEEREENRKHHLEIKGKRKKVNSIFSNRLEFAK
jgi:hypothetical protein